MMVTHRRCRATTKNTGDPCQMPPMLESDFCWNHDPDVREERAAARRRGGYNRRRPAGVIAAPEDLREVSAVQRLLERAVADTLAQENSIARNRSLGYLAGLAIKAIEARTLEERVEALESRLAELGSAS